MSGIVSFDFLPLRHKLQEIYFVQLLSAVITARTREKSKRV
jgi:hypothetical protein